MKAITISPRAKTLNSLLRKARRRSVILKSSDGEEFVLARVTNMQGFDVGGDDDFEKEVEATRKNKRLMKFLDQRAARAKGQKHIPIAQLRRQLDLTE